MYVCMYHQYIHIKKNKHKQGQALPAATEAMSSQDIQSVHNTSGNAVHVAVVGYFVAYVLANCRPRLGHTCDCVVFSLLCVVCCVLYFLLSVVFSLLLTSAG